MNETTTSRDAYSAAKDRLRDHVRELRTDAIADLLMMLAFSEPATKEHRLVRIALMRVYEEREGGDALDDLLDAIADLPA